MCKTSSPIDSARRLTYNWVSIALCVIIVHLTSTEVSTHYSAILEGAHCYFVVSSLKCEGKNSCHDLLPNPRRSTFVEHASETGHKIRTVEVTVSIILHEKNPRPPQKIGILEEIVIPKESEDMNMLNDVTIAKKNFHLPVLTNNERLSELLGGSSCWRCYSEDSSSLGQEIYGETTTDIIIQQKALHIR